MTKSLSTDVVPFIAALAAVSFALTGCSGGAPGDSKSTELGVSAGNATQASDPCPEPSGVSYNGYQRFMFGAAYPWGVFGAADYYGIEFGGLNAWGMTGVSARKSDYVAQFRDMKANNVNVVRWFMLPVFKSDAVVFDGGTPVGIGGSLAADIEAALDVARQEDMYIIFSLFDFHAFSPAHAEGTPEKWVSSLYDIVMDSEKTAALLQNVVTPVARIVQNSANADRVLAWEPMNEPDWVVNGTSDGNAFSPDPQYQQISSDTMRSFLQSMIAQLKQNSSALMTIGSAGLKWRHAWSGIGDDFYEIHHYQWDEDYWPSTQSPASYGLTDKPAVFGEFPNTGLTLKATGELQTLGKLFESWKDNGYAGAVGWSYNKDWPFTMADATGASVSSYYSNFGAANACRTSFSAAAAGEPTAAPTGGAAVASGGNEALAAPAAAAASTPRYEAEWAGFSGVASESARAGYSGQGYVGDFAHDGDWVSFVVNSAGGEQPLWVGYAIAASDGDKTNDIYVNGTLVASFVFPNTGDAWQRVQVGTVTLQAGSNKIDIRKNWGYFDVDYIDVP